MAEQGIAWAEPSSRIPLRWGSYRARYLAGVAAIFAGGILIHATSAYSLIVLPIGASIHVAGWCVMPAIGWRRIVGAVVGFFTMIALLNGAQSAIFLTATLAVWLLLRQRRPVSYITLVVPAVTSLLLANTFPNYDWGVLAVTIAAVVLIGSAWLAWLFSLRRISGRSPASNR